jgi:hypothetical protein
MVIMTRNPSLTKSLIATSISVVIFGLYMGFRDKQNALSTTMAYAAVLVVFVALSVHP